MIMHYKRVKIAEGQATIVVAFDICSSSDVIEQLTTRGDIDRYRRMIARIKQHLAKAQNKILFDPYKFTGDGWILLFPAQGIQGRQLMRFMVNLSAFFKREFKKLENYLDTPPKVRGITFGIDKGPIFHTTIYATREYIGRPINVACRLQGAIKDRDRAPGYKALATRAVYNDHLASVPGIRAVETERKLRNIRNDQKFKCMKIRLQLGLPR